MPGDSGGAMESDDGGGPSADGNGMCHAGLCAEFLSTLETMLQQHHDRLVEHLQPRPLPPATISKLRSTVSKSMDREASKASHAPQHQSKKSYAKVSSLTFTKSSEDPEELGSFDGFRSITSEEPDELHSHSHDDGAPHEGGSARTSTANSVRTSRATTFSQAEAFRRITSLRIRPDQNGALLRSESSVLGGPRQLLRAASREADRMIKSTWFEVVMSVLIMSNTLFCGAETEYLALMKRHDPPRPFVWISMAYTVVFSAELLLRMLAEGLLFVRKPNWAWNLFDTLIVIVSLLDVATGDGEGGNRQVASVRVIRMARVVRVLRIARIMRHFRSLRILIYSVLNTLRSLLWTMLLLTILLYVFGILFTQATTQHLLLPGSPFIKRLEDSYGTVGKSIFTLFKAISGGVNWEEIVRPLGLLHPVWVAFFLVYFSFTYFAVLNVVTGVFCNTAIESASHDQEMAAQAQIAAKQHYVRQLKSIFQQINVSRDGCITLQQFEECLKDEKLLAYFASIDLTVSEAFSLFKLLDLENKHVLDVDTFVTGCLKLRGQAKSIEIAMAMYETRWNLKQCLQAMKTMDAKVEGIEAYISDVAAIVDRAQFGVWPGAESAGNELQNQGADSLTQKGDVKHKVI